MSGSIENGHHPATESMIFISNDEVRRVLTWDDAIREVRESLVSYSRGPDHPEGTQQPLRTRMNVGDRRWILTMPGLAKKQGALAVKILTVFDNNSSDGHCSQSALIILINSDTGLPLAVLDGDVITEMRTAAASAVITMELVEKKENLTVAILGAGAQGRAHARVMAHVYKGCKIRIWNRTEKSAKALASMLMSEGLDIEVSESVKDAVHNADIINTCSKATSPILKKEWVKPGVHINNVSAPYPGGQELEEELFQTAVVYTDSKESATKESGNKSKAVYAEIGEVLLGLKPVKRETTTIFKSFGLAVEDAVSAQFTYNQIIREK